MSLLPALSKSWLLFLWESSSLLEYVVYISIGTQTPSSLRAILVGVHQNSSQWCQCDASLVLWRPNSFIYYTDNLKISQNQFLFTLITAIELLVKIKWLIGKEFHNGTNGFFTPVKSKCYLIIQRGSLETATNQCQIQKQLYALFTDRLQNVLFFMFIRLLVSVTII